MRLNSIFTVLVLFVLTAVNTAYSAETTTQNSGVEFNDTSVNSSEEEFIPSSEYMHITPEEKAKIDKFNKALKDNDKAVQANLDRGFSIFGDAVDKVVRKVKDEFSTLDVMFVLQPMLKLGGFYFGPGMGAGVKPAYRGSYYSRSDLYRLKGGFDFHKFGDLLPVPVYLHFGTEAEIELTRFYGSQKQALKQWPRKPSEFPFTSVGIDNMQPGDLSRIRLELVVEGGAKYTVHIPDSPLEVKMKAVEALSGMFDIFIFKGDDNKARLTISGLRSIGPEGYICISLDIIAGSIIGADELGCGRGSSKTKTIFLADYVLDLSYPEVREAYDQLLARTFKFKDKKVKDIVLAQMANYKLSRNQLSDLLVANVSRFDEIFREDHINGVPQLESRIHRSFSGSDEAVNTKPAFDISFNIFGLIKYKNSQVGREHRVRYKHNDNEGHEEMKHLFFPTWGQNVGTSLLFGWRGEEYLRRASIIYQTDPEYNLTEFKSIGFYYDYTDKWLKPDEQTSLISHFEQIMPAPVFSEFTTFLAEKHPEYLAPIAPQKNVKVSARYYLTKDGVEAIRARYVSPENFVNEVRKMVASVVDSLPYEALTKYSDNLGQNETKPSAMQGVSSRKNDGCTGFYSAYSYERVHRFCREIEHIANNFLMIATNVNSLGSNYAVVSELLENQLFRQIGPGLIYKMVPVDKLAESVQFEVVLTKSSEEKTTPFVYPGGCFKERDFYEVIANIVNKMDGIFPDPRLPGDVDSLTTRSTFSDGSYNRNCP